MPVLVGKAHEQAGDREDEGPDGKDQRPVEVVRGDPHEQKGRGKGGHKSWPDKNLQKRGAILC